MITIAEYPQIKLYWYDDERTILVGDVEQGWTWEHGHKALRKLNDTTKVWAETRSVYVIMNFEKNAQSMPKGESAIINMRKMLHEDPSDETLTIIVAEANILGSLINLATRMYQVADNRSKYRYVATFDKALDIVRSHKITTR